MKILHRCVAVGVLAAVVAVAAGAARGQSFKRIDGSGYTTVCVRLDMRNFPPPPPVGDPECAALPILEDGWTSKLRCIPDPGNPFLEAESYLFGPDEEYVVFVNKIKLAINPLEPVAQRFQVVEDILVIPCVPRSTANPLGEDFRPNSPPRTLFIDDVVFPVITLDEPEIAAEYLCAVFVPLAEVQIHFGSDQPVMLDWFAVADIDSLGTFYGQPASIDTDGNGAPDSCVELGVPGKFLPRLGIDDKGSNLTIFLQNRAALGLTHIDVFDPVPTTYIPSLLPGMSASENGTTRPWCFTILPHEKE